VKKLIKKILKEESKDFDWTKSVDPLDDFSDYFYGTGNYIFRKNTPGRYIRRDSGWWRNWIEDVEMAHPAIMEDVADLEDMVGDLVNPRRGKTKEYKKLAVDVYEFFKGVRVLGGKSIIEDSASTILDAYNIFGLYAEQNNLTIFEVMDIFTSWLDKMDNEGIPLHDKNKDG